MECPDGEGAKNDLGKTSARVVTFSRAEGDAGPLDANNNVTPSPIEVLVPRVVGHCVDVTQFLRHQRINRLHAEGRRYLEYPSTSGIRQLLHPPARLRDGCDYRRRGPG